MRSKYPCSCNAATPAACAGMDTPHGCPQEKIRSAKSLFPQRPYPRRRPGMAKLFVNALRITEFAPVFSTPFSVFCSGCSRNSLKHSSTTRRIPASSQRFQISCNSAGDTVRPVGLLGLQRKSKLISGVSCCKNASGNTNPSLSCKGKYAMEQSIARSACSYSAKVGSSSSALRGCVAATIRKIRSAAPFPQTICSAGMPSYAASAARNSRQSGSGYCVHCCNASAAARTAPGGIPIGLMFAEKSSGSCFIF